MRTLVVSPTGQRSTQQKSLAIRPRSLDGIVVGLLDNNKPGARELFDGLEPRLREAGVAEFVYRQKAHPAGPSPYLDEVVDRADVALSALGD